MGSPFGWVVAVFAVIWIALAVREVFRQSRAGKRLRWLVLFGGFLLVTGALGFFGSALLAVGMVRLPSSIEWPPGYVDGVITTPSGLQFVPLEPSGRVQVYDANWRYLRGWQVNAGGGDFKLVASRPGKIEVYTSRQKHHFIYSESGELLTSESYGVTYDSVPNGGRSLNVPTSPLLWPFSSPFLSWGLAVIGMLVLRLTAWLQVRPTSPKH